METGEDIELGNLQPYVEINYDNPKTNWRKELEIYIGTTASKPWREIMGSIRQRQLNEQESIKHVRFKNDTIETNC